MRLYAISDVHLAHRENREILEAIPAHPDDWLILAGDVGESPRHLAWALDVLGRKYARLVWVPGNHDLWTHPKDPDALAGEARYLELVELCRSRGVLTPEDPYVVWDGEGGPCRIAPLFVLYDYSFRPDDVPREDVLRWALEDGILCRDEHLLHPDPYPTREAWCAARVELTERRLDATCGTLPLVLVNHFPLRRDLVRIPRVPRFAPWCGTRHTEQWHARFGASVVVTGHLHVPSTDWIDGVRFEEVSLGYPRQWKRRAVPPQPRAVLPHAGRERDAAYASL